MDTNKGRKTVILESWFVIDQILFGRPAKEVLSEDKMSQYLTSKGAFLSNLYEIYSRLGYSPDSDFDKISDMVESARLVATEATKKAKDYVQHVSVSKLVKEEIQKTSELEGLKEEQVAKFVVLKRMNAVAMDSALLETIVKESKKQDQVSDWQGKVLIDAHKTLRDNLIDISM